MEQDMREKVIKALELCTSKIETRTQTPCETCPYHNKKYHGVLGDGCCNARSLQRDALALLKAQEPHLVTEADFENADPYGYLPVWVEDKDDSEIVCDCITKAALTDVGSGYHYRYWTSRPTDAQREAVKWE